MDCVNCYLFDCGHSTNQTDIFSFVNLDKQLNIGEYLLDEKEFFIFGYSVNISNLNRNSISHLICMMRKYSDYFRNIVINVHDFIPIYKNNVNLNFIRKEIHRTLIFFKNVIISSKLNYTLEDKRFVLNELKLYLFHLNRISYLPEIIFYELNMSIINSKSSSNQLFHLYFDVWWNVYEIFKSADKDLLENFILIRDINYTGDILNQFLNIILSDLIFISLTKFNIHYLDNNHICFDPFICGCTKLVFILIYKNYDLIKHDHSSLHLFWNDFNKILDCFNNNYLLDKSLESVKYFNWVKPCKKLEKNSEFASLWLISNLVPILIQGIDSKIYQSDNFSFQNQAYVLNIVKNLIKIEDGLENVNYIKFSNIIKFCFKLSTCCDLKIDLILPFLDYYMKRLNNFFLQNNVDSMQLLYKSGFIWQQKLRNFVKAIENIDNEKDLKTLFYCLIYNFLKKLINNQDPNLSNQIQKFKGRFYSKLQPKKIENLNEIGVFNLLNLFLIVLYTNPNQCHDLLEKYSFIIKIVKEKSIYNSKMKIILKSLFCCNYLLNSNDHTSKLFEIIVDLFKEICDKIPEWNSINTQTCSIHNSYFDLINIYFDELNLYLENVTDYHASFTNIFTSKIIILLPKLSDREVIIILQFVDNILFKIIEKFNHIDFSCNLLFYNQIYLNIKLCFVDFLKFQSLSNNLHPNLPDIIFGFFYLSSILFPNEQDFKNYLQTFVFNKKVNSNVCCKLVLKLIQNEITNNKLLECHSDSLEKKFIELWFKLSVNLNHPNTTFNELSQHLSKLFKIFYSNRSGLQNIFDIFKNLNNKFMNLVGNEKINMAIEINQCMNEIISTGKSFLKNEICSDETLNQFYIIISSLVENCFEILYIQGNNNMILPQILEIFYNPLYIQNLPVARHQPINNAIRKTLPNFLSGMTFFHDINDVYLKRKLKQILFAYIPMFLSKGPTHPILLTLKKNDKIKRAIFSLILNFLDENFFSKSISNPSLFTQTIQFITDMFHFIKENHDLKDKIFYLYPHFLEKLLRSEELIKRRLREFLLLITNDFKNSLDADDFRIRLTDVYSRFIINNKDNLVKVIQVLDYLNNLLLFEDIKENIISSLMHLISDLEQSSFGIDNQLRTTFQQFVNKITNK